MIRTEKTAENAKIAEGFLFNTHTAENAKGAETLLLTETTAARAENAGAVD